MKFLLVDRVNYRQIVDDDTVTCLTKDSKGWTVSVNCSAINAADRIRCPRRHP